MFKMTLSFQNFILPLLLTFFCSLAHAQDAEKVFGQIYEQGVWGKDQSGRGTSGGGSTLKHGKPFVDFLQAILNREPRIRSVVDVGCGDWVLASRINWGKRDYIGIDVVDTLISTNQSKFGSPKVHFIHLDAITKDLPAGDLVICKDVLQHLPNACILSLLEKFKKFRYCILVNDCDPDSKTKNPDISIGSWRSLDLTAAPFSLKPKQIYTYSSEDRLKQILLLENAD